MTDDKCRGTGRTTGLMLLALGNASLARGEYVPFVDHCEMSVGSARIHKECIELLAKKLGLDVDVRLDGKRIALKSNLHEYQENRRGYMMQQCGAQQ